MSMHKSPHFFGLWQHATLLSWKISFLDVVLLEAMPKTDTMPLCDTLQLSDTKPNTV